MKTDSSIKNICTASIKRHTRRPYDFLFTRFFENETFAEINNDYLSQLDITDGELPIAQTIINPTNWTLVTTRQITSCVDGVIKIAKIDDVVNREWNDFKGYNKTAYTIGQLTLNNNETVAIFIETGPASMVVIYAIQTVLRLRKHN